MRLKKEHPKLSKLIPTFDGWRGAQISVPLNGAMPRMHVL